MAWGESRRGTPITLIGIHTNEGNNPPHLFPDRTAENLADWLTRENNAGRHKSYQTIFDDDSAVEFVPDHLASWAMKSGNLRSVNLCFTGWARWSRAEWLDHPAMLTRGAAKVRHWCAVHNIPQRRVTGAQIRAGQRGVCGHGDWSDSDLDDSTHTDPGVHFPWDVFLELVEGDDMSADAERMIREIHEKVRTPLPSRVDYRFLGEPEPKKRGADDLFGMALNADGRSYEARQVAVQARDASIQALREVRVVNTLLTVITDQLTAIQAVVGTRDL